MPSLELRLYDRSGRMRESLDRDRVVQVWRGDQLLGIATVGTLLDLYAQSLSQAELQARMIHELVESSDSLRLPPKAIPSKVALRSQRQSRKPKRLGGTTP